MDFSFIEQCRKIRKDNLQKNKEEGYKQLVDNLLRKDVRGKEKATHLGEYDGESLFKSATVIPGCVYTFLYKAETECKWESPDKKIQFTWYDRSPLVLVTHVKGQLVRGVNLSLCNESLRAFIINTLHNLDKDFYGSESERMAIRGKAPYSEQVLSTLQNEDKEKQFFQYIKQECHLQNTGILFRHYNISRMQNIRMVETWQHQYIPFLDYAGEVKQDVLKLIWKVTGIDGFQI
jgi:hypothetical protein